MRKVGIKHVLLLGVLVVFVTMGTTTPSFAKHKWENDALIGGGAGLLFGGGLGHIIEGAGIGGAIGLATGGGHKQHEARKGAKTGAEIGAGAGLLFGEGLGGVLGGAVLGGSAGAIYGGTHH